MGAPSPFLLDLLAPHVQVSRREGKQVNDGYGVPDDSYGAPVSSTVSSYEAPKYSSSTVPPCSYQAPTTTTTPPPSYGAPGRHQEQPVLPDILGFIGGILKPKKIRNPMGMDVSQHLLKMDMVCLKRQVMLLQKLMHMKPHNLSLMKLLLNLILMMHLRKKLMRPLRKSHMMHLQIMWMKSLLMRESIL